MSTPIPDALLDEIESLLRSGQLAVFCGAGISRSPPSNLPLASELTAFMLEGLLGPKHCISFKAKFDKLPLELLIEIIARNADTFLPVFAQVLHSAEPNRNHLFLARLIANGHLQAVMTTNFDLLIERALTQQDHVNFEVYSREDQFEGLESKDLLQPSVVKLHGTADDLQSIRSTLRDIATVKKSAARKDILNLFFGKLQKDVLVLGYSARDEFDINPAIRSMVTETRIFHVVHTSNLISETHALGGVFATFGGLQVRCNTQQFLTALRSRLFREEEVTEPDGVDTWKQFLHDQWFSQIDEKTKLLIASEIMETIGEFAKAREYLLEHFRRSEGEDIRMLLNLGRIEQEMHLSEAKGHLDTCLNAASTQEDDFLKARALQLLGQVAHDSSKFISAKVLAQQSQELFQRIRDESTIGLSAILYQLGMTYLSLELPRAKAEKLFQQSIELSRELGDLVGEARSLAQLGLTYKQQNRPADAIGVINQARSIYVETFHI